MADIKNHPTLPTGLVSYWNLDESGGVRKDSYGNNNLQDYNTVGSVAGLGGRLAANFNADNAESLFLDTQNSGLFISSRDVSVSDWFRISDNTIENNIITDSSGNNGVGTNFTVRYRGNLATKRFQVVYARSFSGPIIADTYEINLTENEWYFVVATIDISSGNVGFLLKDTDGVSLINQTINNNPGYYVNTTGRDKFSISSRSNSRGAIDMFISTRMQSLGVWSKVLSSGEKNDLYNNGVPLFYENPLVNGGVVGQMMMRVNGVV